MQKGKKKTHPHPSQYLTMKHFKVDVFLIL